MQIKLVRNNRPGNTGKDRETPEGAFKVFVSPKDLRVYMQGREHTCYNLYKNGRRSMIHDKNFSALENFF